MLKSNRTYESLMYIYEQIYVCICIISLEYHIGLFESRDNQRWKAIDMEYQSLYFFLNIAQQFFIMKLRKIPWIKLFIFYFLFFICIFESYKQDRTYESLLNSMYSRGILFCFASALSFQQHQNEGCEAKPCPLLNIAQQFVLSSIL